MKYLWIGNCLSDETKDKMIDKGVRIMSSYVSQSCILDGLEKVTGIDFDTINACRVPEYPAYDKHIFREEWSRTGKSTDVQIGYRNTKYFSHLYKRHSFKKEAEKWGRLHKDDCVTVFVYSMSSEYMSVARKIKREVKNCMTVLVVPDLPQYMDMNMSPLKRFFKAIDWISIKGMMKYFDKYVLYSEHMAEFLNLKKGSWTVMEGAYDPSIIIGEKSETCKDTVSIMYSGVLDLRYGIRELLDSMKLLDDKYELWLTGAGNAVPLIEERQKGDKRIKYFGYFPSRYDLLKKQREATMLISTRNPDEAASMYCFPSKIFEYMVSGNPVISTRIGGIPEEYFDYLLSVEDISPEGIAGVIKNVGNMSETERNEIGNRGRLFVLEKKNNVSQSEKILNFIGDKRQ